MGHKIDSLYTLMRLELNTPEIIMVFHPDEGLSKNLADWERTKHVLLKQTLGHRRPNFSIRTERILGKEFKSPHFPNVPVARICKEVPTLLRKGYEVIIQEGINPKNCAWRGNFYFRNRLAHFEYLRGPGTVRDLEKKVPLLFNISLECELPPGLQFLHPIFMDLGVRMPSYAEKIFEWSIYRHPVGLLKQRQIYWEIRPWS